MPFKLILFYLNIAIVLVVGSTLLSSCAMVSEPPPAPAAYCLTTKEPGNEKEPTPVTFYKDLLPILESNASGRAFKCTTCHAHYAKPEGLNSVPEIARIVDSMKQGRMPRSNDRVPLAEISKFSLWQAQGFKAGTPGSATAQQAIKANENCN